MYNFGEICRLCSTNTTELVPLTSQIEKNLTLTSSLKKYLNISIYVDELPQNICLQCYDFLLKAEHFHNQCNSSENYLRLALDIKGDHSSYYKDEVNTSKNKHTNSDDLGFQCMKCDLTFEFKNNFCLHQKYAHSNKDLSKSKFLDYTFFNEIESDGDNEIPIVDELSEQMIVEDDKKSLENFECYKILFGDEKKDKLHYTFSNENESDADYETPIVYDISETTIVEENKKQFEHFEPNRFLGQDEKKNKSELSDKKLPVSDQISLHATCKHKCFNCDKTFYSRVAMTKHLDISHGVKEQTISNNGDTEKQCPICGLFFWTEGDLLDHQQKDHRPTKRPRVRKARIHTFAACKQCGKIIREDMMKYHMYIHQGIRPYKCEYCDRRFTQRNAWKTHLTLHLGKPVPCTYQGCTKSFARGSMMRVHLRSHTKERPFLCKTCGSSYRYRSHLTYHERTHSDQPAFPCKICDNRFSSVKAQRKHLLTEHIGKPYQCPNCDKKFLQPKYLRSHNFSVHKFDIGTDHTIYKVPRKYIYDNYPEDNNLDDNLANMQIIIEPSKKSTTD